jgi:hypothetical protein
MPPASESLMVTSLCRAQLGGSLWPFRGDDAALPRATLSADACWVAGINCHLHNRSASNEIHPADNAAIQCLQLFPFDSRLTRGRPIIPPRDTIHGGT